MIFRDRVGGGGNTNESLLRALPAAGIADDRFRDLTTSLGCIGYGVLGDAWDTGETGSLLWDVLNCDLPALFMAGGGSSNAS